MESKINTSSALKWAREELDAGLVKLATVEMSPDTEAVLLERLKVLIVLESQLIELLELEKNTK